MVNWQYYPKSDKIPTHLVSCINIFNKNYDKFTSESHKFNSDEVLRFLAKDLLTLKYEVETGKNKTEKVHVPVLFGLNGKLDKYFEADAYNTELKTVIEVEAGRGVTNYQFLKDLFQACLMHDVDYLVIAVRNIYLNSKDFYKVINFFDALYSSGRLKLPLKGILVIGY